MTARRRPRLRFDVTTNEWVLFAPERAKRPGAKADAAGDPAPAAGCPFCPGHEDETPAEIARVPDPTAPGRWLVRVVPNKFPALERAASLQTREQGPLFVELGGHGVHEVVVESPHHDVPLARQSLRQAQLVVGVVHDRYVALAGETGIRAVLAFKNHGRRAGASIAHPHWQLVATPVVPLHVRQQEEIAASYYERNRRCLACMLLDEELRAGERILSVNDGYVALLPFASSVPYHVRIAPREHRSSFGDVPGGELPELAAILLDVLGRLDRGLRDPAFNLTLTTSAERADSASFSWHIDILPRLGVLAGFELGSGMWVNPVLPEEATRLLRSA